MKIKNLPLIEISKEQRIWLFEAWKILMESGRKVPFQKIRVNTIEKTGTTFNPHNIDGRLATFNSTNITLLGLLSIDSEAEILKVFDIILLHLKEYLIENPGDFEFRIDDLAEKLNLEEKTVGLVFYFLEFCGSFYSGGGSSGKHNYIWHERYEITSPTVFDCYMGYSNFNEYLNNYYLQPAFQENNAMMFASHKVGAPLANIYESSYYFGHKNLFVNEERIKELEVLKSDKFDFTKLIRLCEEINISYASKCFYSTSILTRVIMDHIPPLFEKSDFSEVTKTYGTRSFRDSMINLNKSSRKIADAFLHTKIRKKETTLNCTQVDFRSDLDVLLGEIVRVLG